MTEPFRQLGRSTEPILRASTNWEDVHRRLEAARAALESGWKHTAEENARVLRERASMLAQDLTAGKDTGEHLEIVEFVVANERYGIEAHHIGEVYPLRSLTPLPSLPPFVLGVVNVRGRIIPIVDIKKFFELPDRGLSDRDKLLIISTDGIELGLVADRVLAVRPVALQEIQPSLPTLTGIREEFLKGVTRDQMVILDAIKILTDKRLAAVEQSE